MSDTQALKEPHVCVEVLEDDPYRNTPLSAPTSVGTELTPSGDGTNVTAITGDNCPVSLQWQRLNPEEKAIVDSDGPVLVQGESQPSSHPAPILCFSHDPIFLGPVPAGESGFKITLPEVSRDMVLAVLVGVWHATIQVTVTSEGDTLFAKQFTTASIRQYQRLTIETVGKPVTVIVELTMKTDTEGCAIFADAVADEALPSACVQAPRYAYSTSPGLVATFGWEGDRHAPIAHIDGSFQLRDNANQVVTFGMPDIEGKIAWSNAEGYLPELISTFTSRGLNVSVSNFADCVNFQGNRLEIAYSRVSFTNVTSADLEAPRPIVWRDQTPGASPLVPLNAYADDLVHPGQTKTYDYAIAADRFGKEYQWPGSEQIRSFGSLDERREHMRQYWDKRLNALVSINSLPDHNLVNALKAGFIYTLIVRDDIDGEKQLNVGENGYDRIFDHDVIGILSTLFTLGDFTYAEDYFQTLTANPQYPDAKWKYSWPWALYLHKTGNWSYVADNFSLIRERTHEIHVDRDNETGVMQASFAIDSQGYWTIDNWSALFGLTTYRYLCDYLWNTTSEETYRQESEWAEAEYHSLFDAVETMVRSTMEKYSIDYLPFSMTMSNEDPANERKSPHDANWASMFLFGRWAWDGYLFGAADDSIMVRTIDATYRHGQERRAALSNSPANFGGYSHGYYSSSYNAGYGSTALRGTEQRDLGIRAYQFMIEQAMTGPFSWWEGVTFPDDNSPWDRPHGSGGGGSSPHMWGQATASKVLVDSLIAEKSTGELLLLRGVPTQWLAPGVTPIEVSNYPTQSGGRAGFRVEVGAEELRLDLSGSAIGTEVILELQQFPGTITEVIGATYRPNIEAVVIPAGTAFAVVRFRPKPATTRLDHQQEQKQ